MMRADPAGDRLAPRRQTRDVAQPDGDAEGLLAGVAPFLVRKRYS